MSNVNIKRAVENIRSNTTVYTPLVEVIVNAIQAIEAAGQRNGRVLVRAIRSAQVPSDDSLADIVGFEVEDNGIGFTDNHRESFDTLYSDLKISEGGKGFGRFVCLKHFEDLNVRSIYRADGLFMSRSFSMGKHRDIIVNEQKGVTDKTESGSVVALHKLKKGSAFDKRLITVARNLVERLLPFFIADDYECPKIFLSERDGSDAVLLNLSAESPVSSMFRECETPKGSFTLPSTSGEECFTVRVFKVYAPRNQRSKICLVAHKRDVDGSILQKYIPEFEDEFCDDPGAWISDPVKNYIIRAYVFSNYLDRNVSLERGGFEFKMERDLFYGIGQAEIEREVATIAKVAVGDEIRFRQQQKRERVQAYVDEEAPWHKVILASVDLSDLPIRPDAVQIETILQQAKFAQELEIRGQVSDLLAEANLEKLGDTVNNIVIHIADSSKNDLVHYVAQRRAIVDILSKSLEIDESGQYSSEGAVHDIIFPRKGDTETVPFERHNLWLVNENLNFTSYLSSELPLKQGRDDRLDLLAYGRRVAFREDNEPSNPVSVFEFKKPQREDFIRPSSKEDPIEQIVRYVNKIQDGKYKTPTGRDIEIGAATPFYGYVVCDLTAKVKDWLRREKNFTQMPDGLGWFNHYGNINLYIEVISWEKLHRDAKMRNQVFFKKLGI